MPGAPRAIEAEGWRKGKLCDITKEPFNAIGDGKSNSTVALQAAIDACGDLAVGGTVLLPANQGVFLTASLWLRSNLTLRIEVNTTLLGTSLKDDAPLVYTRRECVMMTAHAGLLNAGRCLRQKVPTVGWDDCEVWSKLHNVAIEGGGTVDANGEQWLAAAERSRPMMFDLLWVDGLTIRDLKIRRPGFWTIHPTFSNNVRITGNDIFTRGKNTDGADPDSTWNVYIADNTFDTGDDCIAIKSGRDWSGIMVNVSTTNVLVENNVFKQGHGVSIGSETSGWVRNVTVRNARLHGTNRAVRIKSARGRGGGVEGVLYEGLRGEAHRAIELTLLYEEANATNTTATPVIRDVVVRDVKLSSSLYLTCEGLSDSPISNITLDGVHVHSLVTKGPIQDCGHCTGTTSNTEPDPCFSPASLPDAERRVR